MIYNCFTEKNLWTLYFQNNMKQIIALGLLIVFTSCANAKKSTSSTKSIETKKKEAYKDVNKVGDKLPGTRYPNSADTSGTSPVPFKAGDTRGY